MNNSTVKNPMPMQAPEERRHNFSEVALGYSAETAVLEAERCLNCKTKPCTSGCPVAVDIPRFIARIRERDFDGAHAVLSETSSLPAVCGRVCPQERQCESKCVRGIKGEPVAIGRLERFAADHGVCESTASAEKKGLSVAVIGSGPAGLTCAGTLNALGYDVTVFEAFHTAGGVLMYGIPQFRLPKEIVKKEIDGLVAAGVKIELDTVVGRTITVDELFARGFSAVFIGSGAGLPMFMGIKGESAVGVYSANEYLTRTNLMKAYDGSHATPINPGEQVAVVGGGNVAMDAARCALRLGAESVSIVYRRSEAEMPARAEEIEHAKEEGVELKTLCNPVEILEDDKGHVCGMLCDTMELGEPDASGRRKPVVVEGARFTIPLDTVIMALGTSPNPLVSSTTGGLETNKKGCLVADENYRTTRERVWAGGDAVTGAATVILAMGAGRSAAADIDRCLSGDK